MKRHNPITITRTDLHAGDPDLDTCVVVKVHGTILRSETSAAYRPRHGDYCYAEVRSDVDNNDGLRKVETTIPSFNGGTAAAVSCFAAVVSVAAQQAAILEGEALRDAREAADNLMASAEGDDHDDDGNPTRYLMRNADPAEFKALSDFGRCA